MYLCRRWPRLLSAVRRWFQWHNQNAEKLDTSRGGYWNKQWLSSIASLFKLGTSLKGKNLLPKGAKSFLEEQFLLVWKITFSLECYYFITRVRNWPPLECYFFYYARAWLRNGSYANGFCCCSSVAWCFSHCVLGFVLGQRFVVFCVSSLWCRAYSISCQR